MQKVFVIASIILGLNFSIYAEKIKFLHTDKEAMQARIDLIQQAQKEIYIEYYSVTDDDTATTGILLLCEAAKRGVKVKILLDALSSSVKKSTMAFSVQNCKDDSGKGSIEFRLFNPFSLKNLARLFHRTHEKLISVDSSRIIIGGRNVDGKYFGLDARRNYNDLDMLVEGNVSAEVSEYFLKLWDQKKMVSVPNLDSYDEVKMRDRCKGLSETSECRIDAEEILAETQYELEATANRMFKLEKSLAEGNNLVTSQSNNDIFKDSRIVEEVDFLANSPFENVGRKNHQVSKDLYTIFKNAKESVTILSPYLIPNKLVKRMIKNLIAKNVKVTVITNSLRSTDNLFAQAGYKNAKEEMIKMGIELYEYDLVDTTHAKAAVIDGKIALVGTFNLDPRSALINREIGLSVTDSIVAEELAGIIEDFRKNSLLVGKNGEELNHAKQNRGVGIIKKILLNALLPLVPAIKHQL